MDLSRSRRRLHPKSVRRRRMRAAIVGAVLTLVAQKQNDPNVIQTSFGLIGVTTSRVGGGSSGSSHPPPYELSRRNTHHTGAGTQQQQRPNLFGTTHGAPQQQHHHSQPSSQDPQPFHSNNNNQSCNTTLEIQLPLPPPLPPKELPLRFLRAGKNDPIVGLQRYEATLQWRKEHEIDTILRQPYPNFHLIKQHYPHYFHLRGRNDEPCFYEQPAKTNLQALRENGVHLEHLLRHYTMITEFLWQYLDRRDLAKSIYIIDLDGIRMMDFFGETLDFVKKAASFSAQHYPERAGCVFVVNVPSWFKLIWQALRPLIDESTLKKIYILRGAKEIREKLLERIPLENIPIEYGGTGLALGQAPEETLLLNLMNHNNALASQQRSACEGCISGTNPEHWACPYCRWTPARSY